ncbi:MAG: hypothetical protein IT581_23040 [Verrucomicrobiales bacterium]|nr:hypothetical protein [Verrucomicrobiales bacterium]
MNPRSLVHGLAGLVCLSPSLWAASAPNNAVVRLTGAIVAGGGSSTGPNTVLVGAIPSVGSGVSAGGSYILSSGSAAVLKRNNSSTPVLLSAKLTANHTVVLEWPASAQGYVLESSTSLDSGGVWTPVIPQPTSPTYSLGSESPAKFFRLRRL